MANTDSVPFLSDYSADFWQDYVNNYKIYDAQFNRLYKGFVYYNQDYGDDVADVLSDFKEYVKAHLMLNSKKYSELYRVQVLDDDMYSIVDNYNITETMDKSTTDKGTDTYGERTDENSVTKGEATDTFNTQSAPYDSENFYNDTQRTDVSGSRTDNSTITKGSQSDNHSNDGTEQYTLKRNGNIGVRTITAMLQEHTDFWSKQEFYTYIFSQICADILLVNGG